MFNKYLDEDDNLLYVSIDTKNELSKLTKVEDIYKIAIDFPKIKQQHLLFKMFEYIKTKEFVRLNVIKNFLISITEHKILYVNNVNELKDLLKFFNFSICKLNIETYKKELILKKLQQYK